MKEMHYIPLKDRRDYCPFFAERDRNVREGNLFLLTLSLILLIAGIAYWIFLLTPTVKAGDSLRYQDVHTETEACAYLHQHPGSIKNVTWCKL